MKNQLSEVEQVEVMKSLSGFVNIPYELFDGVNYNEVDKLMSEAGDDSTKETAEKLGKLLGLGSPIGEGTEVSCGISEDHSLFKITSIPKLLFENQRMNIGETQEVTLEMGEVRQIAGAMLNALDAIEKGTFEAEMAEIGEIHTTIVNGVETKKEFIKR